MTAECCGKDMFVRFNPFAFGFFAKKRPGEGGGGGVRESEREREGERERERWLGRPGRSK